MASDQKTTPLHSALKTRSFCGQAFSSLYQNKAIVFSHKRMNALSYSRKRVWCSVTVTLDDKGCMYDVQGGRPRSRGRDARERQLCWGIYKAGHPHYRRYAQRRPQYRIYARKESPEYRVYVTKASAVSGGMQGKSSGVIRAWRPGASRYPEGFPDHRGGGGGGAWLETSVVSGVWGGTCC